MEIFFVERGEGVDIEFGEEEGDLNSVIVGRWRPRRDRRRRGMLKRMLSRCRSSDVVLVEIREEEDAQLSSESKRKRKTKRIRYRPC